MSDRSHHHDYLGREALFCKTPTQTAANSTETLFPLARLMLTKKPTLVWENDKTFFPKENWSIVVAEKLKHLRAKRLNLQWKLSTTGNTTQKAFLSNSVSKHVSGLPGITPYIVSTATVHHSNKATKKRGSHKNHLTVKLTGENSHFSLGLLLHEPC